MARQVDPATRHVAGHIPPSSKDDGGLRPAMALADDDIMDISLSIS